MQTLHRKFLSFRFRGVTAAAVGIVAASAAALSSGCQKNGLPPASAESSRPALTQSAALVGNASAAPAPRFVEVAQKAGLSYKWTATGKRPLNILQTIGNGCAFLDYDNDGNLDILLVGPRVALYKGDGQGHFTDVSQATGVANLHGNFLGCAVGDYDNDGHRDIYLSGYQTGVLLHNDGGTHFTDVTKKVGLAPQPWGTSCGFADIDGDGYLDLYVANYANFTPQTSPQMCKFPTEKHGDVLSSCGPRYYQGVKGALLQNRGGKTFADVTKAWGVDTHHGRGLGVAFADVMGDGRAGIAVANDEAPGDLFVPNANKKAKMENVGVTAGVAYDRDGSLHGGMGTDWGDFNNDGRPDLFVATFQNESKSLYRNDGDGNFSDVSYPTGIGRLALPYVSFGTKFLDANNDGFLDLMVASGHVQDNIELIENTKYRQPTLLLLNEGGQSFTDATQISGMATLPAIVGRGLAVGDYDNDGRVDALVVDSEGAPLLLHNETPAPAAQSANANWVGFSCMDKAGRDAYGAVVTVEQNAAPKRLIRECQPSGSYLSSSDPRVHFGLGDKPAAQVKVTVRWPDGKTDTWKDVPTGRYTRLREGKPLE